MGAASIIDQDFESNMMPWIDTSSGQMSWLAELYNDEHEAEPAPQPPVEDMDNAEDGLDDLGVFPSRHS